MGGLAGISAMGLAGCGSSETSGKSTTSTKPAQLPKGSDAPFDTVVVVMMENRSFDAMLGWLPGADGKQAGLSYVDATGERHATWHLAPDWQGCQYQDPFHIWQAVATQFNDGKIDGFLKAQPNHDPFAVGYYEKADLPILSTLAESYTTFDRYFC